MGSLVKSLIMLTCIPWKEKKINVQKGIPEIWTSHSQKGCTSVKILSGPLRIRPGNFI